MCNNLIAEMVKKGYKVEDIAGKLASLLNCPEMVIKNKLRNVEDFTFQEVLKINSEIFDNKMDIKYLFTNKQKEETTYNNEFEQKSKYTKWWI